MTRRFHPRGTDRLLFAIYSPDRRLRNHIETVLGYDDGLRILCDTASFIEWRLFFFGQYEPEIVRLIRATVSPGGCAVDVGANIGCHTLITAAAAGSGGAVLAFEPHPRVAARLFRNVDLNAMQHVTILPSALGAAESTMDLHARPEHSPNQGSATLRSESDSLDARLAKETHSVSVRRLDDVLPERGIDRVDLIKIDVEGYEMPVLLGGRESIAAMRPRVVFEYTRTFWTSAGYTWLDAAGYFEAMEYELLRVPPRGHPVAISAEPPDGNILAQPKTDPAGR